MREMGYPVRGVLEGKDAQKTALQAALLEAWPQSLPSVDVTDIVLSRSSPRKKFDDLGPQQKRARAAAPEKGPNQQPVIEKDAEDRYEEARLVDDDVADDDTEDAFERIYRQNAEREARKRARAAAQNNDEVSAQSLEPQTSSVV